MALHNPELAGVEKILVLNRIDIQRLLRVVMNSRPMQMSEAYPFAISAVTGMGVSALINYLGESIVRSRQGDDRSE